MALQLKKNEPLPNLTVQGGQYQPSLSVQGNQYQAGNIGIAPNVAPAQNISVPNYGPQSTNNWSAPPRPVQPILGTPAGGGINVGHFFGSGAIENFVNAPQQIAQAVQGAQAGTLSREQAFGQVGSALLNSAGWAIPGTKAVKAVEGAVNPSDVKLLTKVIGGVKTGTKVGGGFGVVGGATGAMSQGGTPLQVAESAGVGGVLGAGTGAVLGGTIPVVGAGVRGAVNLPRNEIGAVGKDVQPSSEVIGTPFRGTPVKTVADTQPYYETPRSKGFETSLVDNAPKYGLNAKVQRTGGVWDGGIEPSFKATVDSTDPVSVRAYAAEHGIKGNQDAMITFTSNNKGADTKYIFKTSNPDSFIQKLSNNGIKGATVVGNKVEVVDFGNELRDNIAKLGGKPTKQIGDAGLIERNEYAKAIQEHAQAQNGNLLQRSKGVGGKTPQASSQKVDPVARAVQNENKFKAQISALRKQAPNDNHFYENTILNNVEAPGDVGNLARHIAKRVEAGGEKPTDVLDEVLQPTNLKAEAAAQQSAHVEELKGMVRDLEKSTGQKGLYANVLKSMAGMSEKQQLDYLAKSLTDMRDKGVLATAAVKGSKPNVPEVPKQMLHRVDSGGGSPNVESLQNYGPSRGTGGHGTGLYYNLTEQPLRKGSDAVRTKIPNPMENPFVIKNFEQSGAVNVFGRTLLHHVVSPENATLADVKAAATKAGVKWDENIARQAAAQTKKELNGLRPGVSEKALASVDQPINHYMKALGHDGIINHGVDDTGGGSVIFRGTKAYDKATAPSVTQPTQGAKPFPTEAEFNKMIPAVKGTPVAGAKAEQALTAAEKKALVEQTDKGVKRNEPAINTARNPFKSVRQDITHGDYGAVVSNEQAISRPIDAIGGQWTQIMKKLSPDEQANFWKAVEKPNDKTYSPNLQRAISLWRQADNRIHANSQALGGNTNYLTDHALHPWQLPEEYANHIINGGNPDKFEGIQSTSRKYRTIAEGEKAGLTLGNDPIGEGTRYLQASSALLRRASLKQDIAQADAGEASKTHLLDLGNGHSVQVSAAGRKALRGVQQAHYSDNVAIKGARTANVGLKSTLLSFGQFHPINISLLRAAPTLVMTGHPIAAAKGLYGTFRAAFGTQYAQRVIGKAIDDGTVDKAAKIGMPYGGGGYDTAGSKLKGGVGHHTVFEKQMPMMHDQVVRSIIRDLEKKNISLDSEAARRAGASGNRLMGFINKEAANLPPGVTKAMGDWLLAGQFTPSKIGQVRAAFNPHSYKGGGVAGKYAAASVAANVAASTAVIVGLGYLVKQKSDDVKDMLIRALTDPAVPTPYKDSKGNTVKFRLPGTDTSDISKLLGIKPVRQADGHLGISFNPKNMPQTLQDFARARLAPIPSGVVKVATNSTFSNKPLFDPSKPLGTKTQQALTSLTIGQLPIGAQGVPYTNAVKKHLPGNVQDVLNANTPGSNPVVKSVGSSFGLSPSTDQTTGKGLQSSRYFDALNSAKKGLTAQDQAVFNALYGSKKNPVSGKYDNPANVWDSGARATQLLDHPQVLAAAVKMNQALAKQGQTIDPLYAANINDKQRQIFLSYTAQTEPATRAEMRYENPFINKLTSARSDFFATLPPGDPNKPKAPIPYPNPSPSVANLQNQYFGLTDPAEKAKFIAANPELATQFAAVDQYNRSVRDAKNLPQYDKYPTPTAAVQRALDTYESLPKNDGPKGGSKTRSLWIKAHPQDWNAVTTYLTQTSLYGLEQSAQKAAFQKQGFDQKGLKDISSLGQYDIGKTKDANGNTIYAIAPNAGGGSGGSRFSSGSRVGGNYQNTGAPKFSTAKYMKPIPVSGGPRLPHGGARVPRPKVRVGKLKVAIKGSKNKPENQESQFKKIKLA